MFEVRVHDIDRLRVGRARPGQPLVWAPFPWFSDVRALACDPDGSVSVGGHAGLTRLTADLRACTFRDDAEPVHDLHRGAQGLLGAGGTHLCLWPEADAPAVRWPPAAIGLYGPPRRVRWHPDQRHAAVADGLGQVVVVAIQRGELRPERIVGDVPRVDGLAWHPSGRTLVISGADEHRGRVWSWSADDGLVALELPPLDDPDHATTCAAAFHPRTGALHVVRGRQRLSQGRWGEPLVGLGEPAGWPTDGRFLEFTADAAALLGTTGDGVHVWDRGTHAWYHPGISARVHCDDPCCCVAGDRLLLGTAEGLLVATPLAALARPTRGGAETFCWGVPRLAATDGPVDLAPDGSALALSSGDDRVSVWHLERPARPVTVRTWERAGVHHAWDPRAPRLQLFSGRDPFARWTDLERGEGDLPPAPSAPHPAATPSAPHPAASSSAPHLAAPNLAASNSASLTAPSATSSAATANPAVTSSSNPAATANPAVTSSSNPAATANPSATSSSNPAATANPAATSSSNPAATANPSATSSSNPAATANPAATSSSNPPAANPAATSASNPAAPAHPTATSSTTPAAPHLPASSPTELEPDLDLDPTRPSHGWQLAQLAPDRLILRDPHGRLHPCELPGLRHVLGAAWARNGDLVVVGASED